MSNSKRKEDPVADVEAARAAGQRLARAQKPVQERYIRRVVVAGLLLNARHLPYGLSAPEVFGRGWQRVLGIHVLNDESVAFATAPGDQDRKRAAYWACGIGVALCWPLGATLGAALGALVPDTSALGLDAVFPVILLALILPALRDRATLRPVLIGAALAVATAPFVPAGLPVLIALLGLVFALRPPEPATEQPAPQPC